MSYCHETEHRLKFLAVDLYDRVHIPSGIEVRDEFHRFWLQFAVERIEDFIGGILMGDVSVHKRVDVEFERFELNHLLVGDIGELHGSEVWVSRARAETHELRKFDVDTVILFMFVRPEILFGIDVELLYLFFSVFHKLSFNCMFQ